MAEKSREKNKEARDLAPSRRFSDLTRWPGDIERMMDNFFDRRMRQWWPERWFGSDWMSNTPALDVYEEKDDLVVKAELPGLSKDDVKVNLADHTLIIKGEKKKEEEAEQGNYYRSERVYGSFARTVQLPTEVQPDKVKATFRDGILEIRMPKTEEAKAREIKVQVE
jgi:HSP20 family protein